MSAISKFYTTLVGMLQNLLTLSSYDWHKSYDDKSNIKEKKLLASKMLKKWNGLNLHFRALTTFTARPEKIFGEVFTTQI